MLQTPQDLALSQEELLDVNNVADTVESESDNLVHISPPTPVEDKGDLHANSLVPSTIMKSGGLGGPGTKSMFIKKPTDEITTEEEFTDNFVLPSTAKSCNGLIEFKELHIPPPPSVNISLLTADDDEGVTKSRSKNSASPVTPLADKKPQSGSKNASPDRGVKKKISVVSKKQSKTFKEKLTQTKRDTYCPPGIKSHLNFFVF